MRKASDSLDAVAKIMVAEEVFGVGVWDEEGVELLKSFEETVDWLEARLSNERPNKQAIELLKRIAARYHRADLTTGLNGVWQRHQIEAILKELTG